MDSLTLHQEAEHLRKQLASLQSELRAVLEEWFIRNTEQRATIIATYESLFKQKELELQRVQLQTSKEQRRAELFTIRAQRGQEIDDKTITLLNEMVEKEFGLIQQRMSESFDKTSEERNKEAVVQHTIERTSDTEISRLYRDIAKSIHPDIHGESKDFLRFWEVLQQAYQSKDTTKLRALHAIVRVESIQTAKPITELTVLSLREEIKRLEYKIDYEKRKLARMKNEAPFNLEDKISNPVWVAQHNDVLNQKIAQLQRTMQLAENQVRAILGDKWNQFRAENKNTTKAEPIQDDVFMFTYFGVKS